MNRNTRNYCKCCRRVTCRYRTGNRTLQFYTTTVKF